MKKYNSRLQSGGKSQEVVFVSAMELLATAGQEKDHDPGTFNDAHGVFVDDAPEGRAAISNLAFPFALKPDQVKAAEAWIANGCRGSIIYGTGTGKTEIAFECARRLADIRSVGGRPKRTNILFLVPRVVLVEQNYNRLVKYRIPPGKIGRYFGEEKQISEITISTYPSALANPDVVQRADMIVFDEMHLARGSFSKMIGSAAKDHDKALLGLTATIDETDPRNAAILASLPPVRKYLIKDAVSDKRLAAPVIFPVSVSLTESEQKLYDEYSEKIRSISRRLNTSDANAIMALMRQDGFPRWQARAWLVNVKKRKRLLASSENKLKAALDLIEKKHTGQKVMVFSETLESVRTLRQMLRARGIGCALIDGTTPSFRRQKLLSEWGRRFHALLSVHTLEIGYDVPEAGIEIILATTSNMNQIVQRIGRVLRKVEGKESATIYLIYVADTKDSNALEAVKKAVESTGGSEKAGSSTWQPAPDIESSHSI